MSNVNKIYFRINLNSPDVIVTLNGNVIDRKDLTEDAGSYLVYTEGLMATEFDKIFTLALTKNGKEISSIQYNVKAFIEAKYLSASCNVRRGHAVQNFTHRNVDAYTKRLRIRQKHQEDIQKKRAILVEKYRDYFGDSSFCDKIMSTPYDYDFDQRVEYGYPAPFLAGDSRQIEFISSGNYISVPSSYVTRILVRMEGIYE